MVKVHGQNRNKDTLSGFIDEPLRAQPKIPNMIGNSRGHADRFNDFADRYPADLKEQQMRAIFATIILFCILYFVGGWIAVIRDWVPKESYFSYAGLVGGLASVAGLITLVRPGFTKADVQAVEIETLKSMTEKVEQLKALEDERAKTREEIGDLELRKKEMELLVRKASLALFLKEQFTHYEQNILDDINGNPRLKENIEKYIDASDKLDALNEEIDKDKNVSRLREIIKTSGRSKEIDNIIETAPAILRIMLISAREISRIVTGYAESRRF